MLMFKVKKSSGLQSNANNKGQSSRILIIVNVIGSAGPIRFIVNEDDVVADVVAMALKIYSREGRLPALGSDCQDFLLYSPAAGADYLSPWERIGSSGARNFMLCKMPDQMRTDDDANKDAGHVKLLGGKQQGAGALMKTWLNKSFKVGISAH